MATFRKRTGPKGHPVWQAQIIRVGFRPQFRTFDNKTAATAWAREVEAEMDRGAFIDRSESSGTTLAALLEQYAKEITPTKRGAAQEASHLNVLKKQPLAELRLPAITGKNDERPQETEA